MERMREELDGEMAAELGVRFSEENLSHFDFQL